MIDVLLSSKLVICNKHLKKKGPYVIIRIDPNNHVVWIFGEKTIIV